MSLLALVVALVALVVSLAGKRATLSTDEINRMVDARLAQREQELVSRYKPKLAQMEKDLGLEPSNASTLEDMAKSLGRMIFMPKQ